jgi:hypothetical protein
MKILITGHFHCQQAKPAGIDEVIAVVCGAMFGLLQTL